MTVAVVTGATGLLGRALLETSPSTVVVHGLSSQQLDIRDKSAVHACFSSLRPAIVINTAAYTAVDVAETNSSYAYAVNTAGAAHVAAGADDVGARLVHVSTDYVFNGVSGTPYETDAPTAPLSVYGQTKRDGEEAVLDATNETALIVRTAWLYASYGRNFALTMLRHMSNGKPVRVVDDQISTPTWVTPLAEILWSAALCPTVRGIHHWTDAGVASWYDFAVAIQEEAIAAGVLKTPSPVTPIPSSEYPTAARRPAYSVLRTSALRNALGTEAQHWRVNLRTMLRAMPHA